VKVTAIASCYYLQDGLIGIGEIEFEGSTATSNVRALSDTQMRNKANFIGFDFDAEYSWQTPIWVMPDDGDYPMLRGIQINNMTIPFPPLDKYERMC
jgi:hypothetical protein